MSETDKTFAKMKKEIEAGEGKVTGAEDKIKTRDELMKRYLEGFDVPHPDLDGPQMPYAPGLRFQEQTQ